MKLYTSPSYPLHVIAEVNQRFCAFFMSPILRQVTMEELVPVRKPDDIKEAEDYFYWMYGLKNNTGGK